MSDEQKDGGPAFPSHPGIYTADADGGQIRRLDAPGMTLRDWFAGQALAGMAGIWQKEGLDAADIASDAYRLADAMLAARKEPPHD